MDLNKLLKIVGREYEASLHFVNQIKLNLANASFEHINERETNSTPSIYVHFEGQRVLSFDLRKTESAQVFFWKSEFLSSEIRKKYALIPHQYTGWMGMPIGNDGSSEFREKLLAVTDYWMNCLSSIARGESQIHYKRQALVWSLAFRAYGNFAVLTNKKSIAEFHGRPDVYIPEMNLVIEIDGIQHRKRVPHFHRTTGAFQRQVNQDRQLRELCNAKGTKLLRIVEDAADLLVDPSDLNTWVDKAKLTGDVSYLVRIDDGLSLLDHERFKARFPDK